MTRCYLAGTRDSFCGNPGDKINSRGGDVLRGQLWWEYARKNAPDPEGMDQGQGHANFWGECTGQSVATLAPALASVNDFLATLKKVRLSFC